MPVEESANIDLGTNEKTFEELDRAAAKAIKTLEQRNREVKKSFSNASKAEREQKRLQSRGGIFEEKERGLPTGGGAPTDISKKSKSLTEIIEDKISKKEEKQSKKIIGDIKKQIFGGKELGPQTIKNIVDAGRDPVGFAGGILKKIPFLGGVFALKDITDFIINVVAKLDAFFKAFVDKVDDRHNQLREKVQQAHIQAGDIQLILPTQQGGLEIREPYNTSNEFNDNRILFENENAVRNTSDF